MGWDAPGVAAQQQALALGELQEWRAGRAWPHFDAIAACLQQARPGTLLEVGCASGYLSEVVHAVVPTCRYAGCDLSVPALDLARRRYPTTDFGIADARALPYPDQHFDLVLSGNCLLHLAGDEWATAIGEAARVARQWVLFHKTPIRPNLYATQTITKDAYGTTLEETHVSEAAWLGWLRAANLTPVQVHQWNTGVDPQQVTVLCRKA